MAEQQSAAVAVFETHARAEAAVTALRQAGIGTDSISLAGRGEHAGREVTGHYTRAGAVQHHGGHRGLWGMLSGLLADTGTFNIPGSGPIYVAGPVVGWIANVLEGGQPEAERNPLGAGLAGIGIPAEKIHGYETALQAGQVLLIVHGSADLTARAHAVLNDTVHVASSVFAGG